MYTVLGVARSAYYKSFDKTKSAREVENEEIYRNTYRTFEDANRAIFKYIEGWYNRKRLHSSINYITPNQCELVARSAA